jgi:hypothetical protein
MDRDLGLGPTDPPSSACNSAFSLVAPGCWPVSMSSWRRQEVDRLLADVEAGGD